jgi:NAD(P)-dependent dehydrogenase (short-subunit alcohol dehydrogenase family)
MLPVALVTGASSGFGLLSAVELARRGHRVIATMRDPARRERLDQAAAAAGVELEVVPLDVTSQESIDDAAARVGPVDVLVNNAGFGLGGFFEDLAMDELREQFETNFFGLCAVTKAFVGGMRERRRGRIINVSSISGRIGNPGLSAYVASKFAVEGLSEALRVELLPYGVYVVLVEPGTYRTDIFDRNRRIAKRSSDPSSPYAASTEKLTRLVDDLVAKSTADPADVAKVIVRAATVKRPKLRWLVGRDARAEALAKSILPSSTFERIILKYVGHTG